MAQNTKIQWTDATWNIARGCTKVNSDCKFCYMYRDSYNSTRYNPLQVVRTKTVFNLPLHIKNPSRIFTSSLTDVFHKDIDSYRAEMWEIIRCCPQHTFQILTKRPERIIKHLPADWGNGYDNVWIGVSAGNRKNLDKMIRNFREVKAKVKFLSLEPLHGLVTYPAAERDFWVDVVDWVIIGGESGNNTGKYLYRPCKLEWIESIVEQCVDADTPVFVKQLGTHLAKELNLVDRHGGDIGEFPKHLQIREFPE